MINPSITVHHFDGYSNQINKIIFFLKNEEKYHGSEICYYSVVWIKFNAQNGRSSPFVWPKFIYMHASKYKDRDNLGERSDSSPISFYFQNFTISRSRESVQNVLVRVGSRNIVAFVRMGTSVLMFRVCDPVMAHLLDC